MAYKVRIENFEGPFDLLLYLVSRKKVDISSISIAEITDQYLEEVSRMDDLDLDVASDFLLVASTLLEIKAQSLLPHHRDDFDEELSELTPNEARDALVQSLIKYKQYKNVASKLHDRFEAEGHMHVRSFGPDRDFMSLMPDFLADVTLDSLALLAADAMARREVFLLESEHIAARAIPVEMHIRAIDRRIRACKHLQFSDLVDRSTKPEIIVVTFLALLELYKRQMICLTQSEPFGDISIDFIEGCPELDRTSDDSFTSLGNIVEKKE